MSLPADYAERVYAGVLGKIIGVYLGRPVESWTYERINAEIGEVDQYIHERMGRLLVVTDDDISGTFAFLRALPDSGNNPDLTAADIGDAWLNYIVEGRTILWWGGLGNSTEHTAYLRLKSGIPAPCSGSIELNGTMLAEQIGSQIFIDGWAMVSPGDPERAADFARKAGSVSHDGEAIYGAQVVAAMEAQAFVESDLDKLIDTGLSFIPKDSTIARLIHDVRNWHAGENDWRKTRDLIAANYGYDKYRGNCHMVPNHALIIHSLLHGDDDFRKTLTIVNTCGWDTDCNSGNVGCLLGIKNGLATIDSSPVDWRGPVADRLYLTTADSGRTITDAATETMHVVNIGRALSGEAPLAPKGGARFHFELPGSVQGFEAEGDGVEVENVMGHSALGERSLAVRFTGATADAPATIVTPTFIPTEAITMRGYVLVASPTLYPGQVVRAGLTADAGNGQALRGRILVRAYGANDALTSFDGPETVLKPGVTGELSWRIPDMGGQPIAQVGIKIAPDGAGAADGTIHLDFVAWDGAPDVTFARPADVGTMWHRAWADGVDDYRNRWPEPFRIVKNHGSGLISQGTVQWSDYRAEATVTISLATSGGIAVRVGGMRRSYALILCDDGMARLVKARDGDTILAETAFPWDLDWPYALALEAHGSHLRGWIDDALIFDIVDDEKPLIGGGVGLVITEGTLSLIHI